MDDSTRRQTIQAAITLILLLTFFGIVMSITSCSPQQNDHDSYTVKEKAFLSDIGPLMESDLDTAVKESTVITIGKMTCQKRDAGVSESDIITELKDSWTESQARVMYNSAAKYFCK
jgi:hypothetical protein